MSPYFLAIIALIIFSILVILYVRLAGKGVFSSKNSPEEQKSKEWADFTILE